LQGHAGQDRQQGLFRVVIDRALQAEDLQAAASAGVDWPGILAPLRQSTWMASMARRLTITVRSTGVPVFSTMPETRNGWSSCSTKEASPWATTIGSPTL